MASGSSVEAGETVKRRYHLLIVAVLVVVGITALRPSGTPIGRGEAIAVWAAVTMGFAIILVDLWQSALAARGLWRVLAVLGVATLTSVVVFILIFVGLKLAFQME
jgi:hypothetical protein